MSDPWQSYLTALQVLTGVDDRLLAQRDEADRAFTEQDGRARRLEERAGKELSRTRQAVTTAETDLNRIRTELGVPTPVQDPDHSCTSASQAQGAAVAASEWAKEAETILVSLRRTEDRLARIPVVSDPAPNPVTTPAPSRKPIVLAIAAVIVLIIVVAVALVAT